MLTRQSEQGARQVMAVGGMMDEAGQSVNGVEVPAGSLREEVADDVPAMLSEGEFVIPADVVRYIGLEKLMKMRDAAKEGLKRMEEVGQMGNAEEVVNPDQPFDDEDDNFESEIDDIIGEVDKEESSMQTERMFAAGGYVAAGDISGSPKNPSIDVRYYKHTDGRVMYITHINGKPVTAVPEGFNEVSAEEARQVGKKAEEIKEARADSAVADRSSGSDGGGGDVGVVTPSVSKPTSTEIIDPTVPFNGDPFKMSPTKGQVQKAAGLTVLGIMAGNPFLGAKAIYDAVVNPKSKDVSSVSQEYVNHIESQARGVSSGQFGISGSPFGSIDEARAIAENGFMSDAHMDAVERSMAEALASGGAGTRQSQGGGSIGESWQSPATNEAVSQSGGSVGQDWQSLPADMRSSDSGGGTDFSSTYTDAGGGSFNYSADSGYDFAKGGLVKRRKKK